MMRPRELFFKTQDYILSIKSKGTSQVKGKITASTGKRDISYCYDDMYVKDIRIAIIDIISCLQKDNVKSVKIELTLYPLNGNKILVSDYIEAKDVNLDFGIEWESFLEVEIFKKRAKRKLFQLLEGVEL